jgi:hypothetical protein
MCGWLIESIHHGDLGIHRDDQYKPTPSIKEKRIGCGQINDQAEWIDGAKQTVKACEGLLLPTCELAT